MRPVPRAWERERDERGSVAVEMGLLAVVFFAFVGLSVIVGKLNVASAHVESAARAAARDISIARNTADGIRVARENAADALDVGNAMCESMEFPDPVVTETEVTVTISCTVDLSQAIGVTVPGEKKITAEFTEVIDQYREREP